MKLKKSLILTLAAVFNFSVHAQALKVGSMSGPESDLVEAAAKVAREQYGLEVKVVTFEDYVTPNVALEDGSLDLNAFQHKPYMDAMNQNRGFHLVAVGNTFIYPIGGYSKKIKKIEQLTDGARIAIPNDPSNEGRTLILLDKKGLIKLKDNSNLSASLMDIVANPHHYDFVETDAAQLPRMLDEVDLAFINSNYAVSAQLNPSTDPIIVEDKDSPYVNIIAAREDNKDDKSVAQFVSAYHSQAVEDAARAAFKGGAVKGW